MSYEEDNKNRGSSRIKREKPKDHLDLNPEDYKYIVGIKYTKANVQSYFYSNIEKLRQCSKVLVKTPSGLEFGTVCIKAAALNPAEVNSNEIIGYIEREATMSDKNILNHIKTQKEPEEMEYCKQRIKSREMKMKLVSIEHIFSGEKIIFYFIADGRVDFRELVKDLARRYRTRIEMRQIGVRDEAKMLSDYEHCGRELCCRTFIHDLEPVTMRMAKMQKTTLDPSKISGHCGRLMCCLRFEDEVYKDHKSILPRKGDKVSTAELTGTVISSQILSKNIHIYCEDGSVETINFEDIISHKPASKLQRPKTCINSRENNSNNPNENNEPQDDSARTHTDIESTTKPDCNSDKE